MMGSDEGVLKLSFDNSYARLPDVLFSRLPPVPVPVPALVYYNAPLAASLGLARKPPPDAAAAIFAGNIVPDGAEPIAMAYAGHQFGHFTMLGDGRAILLGEILAPDGQRWDIHFKGSGQTPYSRRGDGRATLAACVREALVSECMFAIGIPTTRVLAIATTGDIVHRDEPHPGAVLTRVGACHIRVGTFAYLAARQDTATLEKLYQYCVARYYPDAKTPAAFLAAVVEAQARLVAAWMAAGFIHGVMNTDNMLINGDTIDFGPCAFLDAYHPDTVFSRIDTHGRYAYSNQPLVAEWNLARFAETLLPLLADDKAAAIPLAEAELARFQPVFTEAYLKHMRGKLGLVEAQPDDAAIIQALLTIMADQHLDYHDTFARLSVGDAPPALKSWQSRAGQMDAALMRQHNPLVLARNHLVEEAIKAAETGDWQPFNALLDAIRHPYTLPKDKSLSAPPLPAQRVYSTHCNT